MPKRFAAALLGGFFMLTGLAIADPGSAGGFAEWRSVCGPRDAVAQLLRADFGERPVADAVTAWGRHPVLFAAPDGASWSIAVTDPRGTTCLIATGVDWQGRLPEAPEPPQPDTRTQ